MGQNFESTEVTILHVVITGSNRTVQTPNTYVKRHKIKPEALREKKLGTGCLLVSIINGSEKNGTYLS